MRGVKPAGPREFPSGWRRNEHVSCCGAGVHRLFFIYTLLAGAKRGLYRDLKEKSRSYQRAGWQACGPNAEVLRAALAEAQFVALGEDHGIRQIPEFAAALCAELAPHGFHHMGLEIGTYVAPELEKMARSTEGVKQLADFEKKYPETIAFYNWQEEFAMVQKCEGAVSPGHMTIWGLDQEFMGATGFLADKILATNPGPEAKTAIETLVKQSNEARAAASEERQPRRSVHDGCKTGGIGSFAGSAEETGKTRSAKII